MNSSQMSEPEGCQRLCCARYLSVSVSRLANPFAVARQTDQRFRFDVNNQVAQFDDRKNLRLVAVHEIFGCL